MLSVWSTSSQAKIPEFGATRYADRGFHEESIRQVSCTISETSHSALLNLLVIAPRAILSDTEHAYALIFSARLADDVPALRIRLSAPTGIRLLVENIKGKISHAGSPPYLVWTLCQIMDHLAFLPWCVPILVHFNVCPTLVDLLM